MQSTWYCPPEGDEPRDASQAQRAGKSRGRGRGRGSGSGRARPAKEPHTPYDIPTMRHNPSTNTVYTPHPYYYNTSGIEEIPAHWQYVANHILQHPYQRNLNQTPVRDMSGYQGFPTRHTAQAGHVPYSQEHFEQFVNISPTHLPRPARANRGGFQSSGNHHFPYIHPGYNRYENQTAPKRHHQQTNKCATQKDHSPQTSRKMASCSSKNTNIQTLEVQEQGSTQKKHSVGRQRDFQITHTVDSTQAQKTLAETAAFLSHPHVTFQNLKDLSSGYAHPAHAKCTTLSHIKHSNKKTIINVDPPQAHQKLATEIMSPQNNRAAYPTNLLFSIEKDQDLSSRHAAHATHENLGTAPQTSDFRRYSELNVTLPIEPPPAHQNYARTEKCLKHLDMTPPLAHQTPVSHILGHPQSAEILAKNSTSPPPAHQATVTSTVHHIHPCQSYELQSICRPQTTKQFSAQPIITNSTMANVDQHICTKKSDIANNTRPKLQQSRRKSNTPQTAEGVISATHSVYHPHQMLGEAQIIYQPSTETFATEQLVYQPQIDMFTKEQMVYHPRKNMIAKTQVIYQPRTDFFATAEAVYQSDIVATRQTVVQPQAGMMKTAAAVYNTQESITSKRKTMQHPRADVVRTTEPLYQKQAETSTARQPTYQRRTDKGSKQTREPTETYILNAYLDKQQTKSSRNENKLHNNRKVEAAHNNKNILRNILSNEQTSDESYKTERNTATLQLIQENYNQVLHNTSNSASAKQTLRQKTKRKISSTSSERLVPPPLYSAEESMREQQTQKISAANITHLAGNGLSRVMGSTDAAGPSLAESTPTEIQSSIALNWTLQSLKNNNQITVAHYVAIENLLKNCSNMTNTKHNNN